MAWAVLVGASVSARMWCSVELTGSAAGMDPYLASVHVAFRAMVLSSLCFVPVASWRAMPRTLGPWLAGVCTVPSASLIMTSKVLGLGLTQMMLKLSTLSTALFLDALAGKLKVGRQQRLVGTGLVLTGVAVAAFGGGGGAGLALGPAVLAGLAGTAASGAGYVLQARLSTPPARAPAEPVAAEEAEGTAAMVCQAVSAAMQLLLLWSLCARAGGGLLDFPVLPGQAHLWLFEGLQGAFFLRSMQVLSKRLGLASTFTLSLCGQLFAAAVLDAVQGAAALDPARLLGLGLVVCGALLSSRRPAGALPQTARVLSLSGPGCGLGKDLAGSQSTAAQSERQPALAGSFPNA